MGGSSCGGIWLLPVLSRKRANLVIESELNIDYLNNVQIEDSESRAVSFASHRNVLA